MDKIWWDKCIPEKFFTKQEVIGLEVILGEEGVNCHYAHLKNKSNKLKLESAGTISSVKELPSIIKKNKIPIVVVVNGKGVLVKKIMLDTSLENQPSDLVRRHLPTVNQEEFFIQLFHQENGTILVSFCRKELVVSVLDDLKENKFELVGVLIGVSAIIGMKPLWSNFNYAQSSLHKIELRNGCVESISVDLGKKEMMEIDGLKFEPEYTLAFAGSLGYLMQNKFMLQESPELNFIETSHIEKNKFKFLTVAAVSIAFLVSITNVVIYSGYFDKNNKLETELSLYQGKYEKINQLLKNYEDKKGLIESAGILNKNRLSEFADRIAKTIPDEILLSEMSFNPAIEREDGNDSLLTFENNHLLIKGNCNKSLIVNEWVNVLKMQDFIKDVNLEKFAYNKESTQSNCEIKLVIN